VIVLVPVIESTSMDAIQCLLLVSALVFNLVGKLESP